MVTIVNVDAAGCLPGRCCPHMYTSGLAGASPAPTKDHYSRWIRRILQWRFGGDGVTHWWDVSCHRRWWCCWLYNVWRQRPREQFCQQWRLGGGGGGGARMTAAAPGAAVAGSGGGIGLLGRSSGGLRGASPGLGGGGGSGGTAGGDSTCTGVCGGAYGGGSGGIAYAGGMAPPALEGGPGACRIIWGAGRAYPSTGTADQ